MALVPKANLAIDPAVNEKLADFERNPSYERRVVAFYDYLGWRNHIEVAGEDPQEIGSLRRMILRHSRMLTVKKDLEVRASTFSDNMVVTQAPSEKTQMLMQDLANVQLGAAINGFLIRGGITVGNIVHDSEVVFGPGLNRAYFLESEIAKYPRIVLDPMTRNELGDIGDMAVVEKGVWFLDPFRLDYLRHLRGAGEEDPEAVANAGLRIAKGKFKEFTGQQVLSMIPDSLHEEFRRPMSDTVFEKIEWLYDRVAKQINLPEAKTLPRIRPK
jgi:hypothetical protein